MPELPEVETIRRGVEGHLLGRRIEQVTILSGRAVRKDPDPAVFEDTFAGREITEVARRGKFLWLSARGTERLLVVHLGMSGQLLVHTRPPEALPRHTAASFRLDTGALLFVDQRTFGHVHVAEAVATADGHPGGAGTARAVVPGEVAHIGRDPLDPHLDAAAVAARIVRTTSAMKRVLLDQRYVSGVGNIYADEILWASRIHPATPGAALTTSQVAELLQTARDVLRRAVAAGGTSFDALYVDAFGESGYFARELTAYGRTGQPCRRCGTPLTKHVIGGRSTHFCPNCQRFSRAGSLPGRLAP